LRQALQQAETAAAADKESLAQERTRNQELAQELAARRDATVGLGRTATASPSDTPEPAPGIASEAPTASLPNPDKPMPAGAEPVTVVPRPAAREVPGNPEAARLMARASLLLGQGNVGAARIVLERAAETGSASALFALAETYDPIVLSAWGTVGTQGDVAKARELYGRASAGGVREARDRLNAWRQ
jgi:TPR repeat protein